MIINIMKDFDVAELHNFSKEFPIRYENLCKIVGEFALGVRHLYLGIVLPYKEDRGCVSVAIIEDEVINIIDTRYF